MVLLLLTLTSGKIMKRLNHLKNTHKKITAPTASRSAKTVI